MKRFSSNKECLSSVHKSRVAQSIERMGLLTNPNASMRIKLFLVLLSLLLLCAHTEVLAAGIYNSTAYLSRYVGKVRSQESVYASSSGDTLYDVWRHRYQIDPSSSKNQETVHIRVFDRSKSVCLGDFEDTIVYGRKGTSPYIVGNYKNRKYFVGPKLTNEFIVRSLDSPFTTRTLKVNADLSSNLTFARNDGARYVLYRKGASAFVIDLAELRLVQNTQVDSLLALSSIFASTNDLSQATIYCYDPARDSTDVYRFVFADNSLRYISTITGRVASQIYNSEGAVCTSRDGRRTMTNVMHGASFSLPDSLRLIPKMLFDDRDSSIYVVDSSSKCYRIARSQLSEFSLAPSDELLDLTWLGSRHMTILTTADSTYCYDIRDNRPLASCRRMYQSNPVVVFETDSVFCLRYQDTRVCYTSTNLDSVYYESSSLVFPLASRTGIIINGQLDTGQIQVGIGKPIQLSLFPGQTGFQQAIVDATIISKQNLVVMRSSDRLYVCDSKKHQIYWTRETRSESQIAISSDSKYMLVSAHKKQCTLYDVVSGDTIVDAPYNVFERYLYSLPSKRLHIFADMQAHLLLRDDRDLHVVDSIKIVSSALSAAATADGLYYVMYCADGTYRHYNYTRRQLTECYEGVGYDSGSVVAAWDNNVIATQAGTIAVRSAKSLFEYPDEFTAALGLIAYDKQTSQYVFCSGDSAVIADSLGEPRSTIHKEGKRIAVNEWNTFCAVYSDKPQTELQLLHTVADSSAFLTLSMISPVKSVRIQSSPTSAAVFTLDQSVTILTDLDTAAHVTSVESTSTSENCAESRNVLEHLLTGSMNNVQERDPIVQASVYDIAGRSVSRQEFCDMYGRHDSCTPPRTPGMYILVLQYSSGSTCSYKLLLR